MLAVLALAARGLTALARRAARGPATRGRPALRWALGALGGPAGETGPVVLALGLGLGVLAAVGQIDANLRGMVARDLPARAPAFFFVDIQNDQLAGFRDARRRRARGRRDRDGADAAGRHHPDQRPPGARGRGAALGAERRPRRSATPPRRRPAPRSPRAPGGRRTTPASRSSASPPRRARELGLKLGDRLTLNVLGRDIEATIASFRAVRFESMGIGFVMIMNPAALAGAPHTHIATVDATPEAEAPLVRAVAEAWPNVTAIGVREGIARVAAMLDGIAAATRWAALATLSTGLFVLDRRRGGRRAAPGLRGGGAEDPRRQPRPHPRELRAPRRAHRRRRRRSSPSPPAASPAGR